MNFYLQNADDYISIMPFVQFTDLDLTVRSNHNKPPTQHEQDLNLHQIWV